MPLTAADVQSQLDNFFVTIVNKIGADDGVLSKALPVLGKLSEMGGIGDALNPFAQLKQDIHDAIDDAIAAGGDPGSAIAQAITQANIPGIVGAHWDDTTGLEISLKAEKVVDLTKSGLDLNASIGSFFTATAEADAKFDAKLEATIVFGTDGTVSLKDIGKPELNLGVAGDLSLSARGELGVADVTITDHDANTPEFSADFGLDLSMDSAGGFAIAGPKVSGSVTLDLDFASTDILKGLLPNVEGRFIASFSVENNEFGSAPGISVENVKVDLSSYLDIAGSTFTDLAKTLNSGALGSMIDIATAPVPALDDIARKFDFIMNRYDKVGKITGGGDERITIGDLAANANPDLLPTIDKWYQALALISEIRKLAGPGGDGKIDLGGGSLIGGQTHSNGDPAAIAAQLQQQLRDLGLPSEVQDFLNGLDINIPGGGGGPGGSQSNGFEFSLFDHPEKILDILLTKNPVDLIKYDVPALAFDQTFGGFFPVLGPLGFELSGTIKAKLDVDVGYDTKGLIDKSFDHGFFVITPKNVADGPFQTQPWENRLNKEYLPAGSFDTLLTGGVGVGFGGASVTVNAQFGFGLYAYFEAADTDGKWRPSDGFECIFDPIGGAATASLNITFKIGFGPFSIKKNIPLAATTLADFTIFTCSPEVFEAKPLAPGLATTEGVDLVLNVGDRAGMRILEDDHGNRSAPLKLADDTSTTGVNESLNEAYIIANARGAANEDDNLELNSANKPPPVLIAGMLDITAFGFTQRIATPTNVITADFKDGNDMLVIQLDVDVRSFIHAGGGDDTLIGGKASDTFYGDGDSDYLSGNDGDDFLYGGAGDDQLLGGKGADTLDGGDGFDTVDYSGANLGTKQGVTVTIGGNFKGSGGEATGDVLINIESLIGTKNDDDFRAVVGTRQRLVFDGGDGNDILVGGKGDDFLLGGAGADVITGNEAITEDGQQGYNGTSYITSWGAVYIDLNRHRQYGGDAEGDWLTDIQAVEGSINNDFLFGNSANNLLFGNNGDDVMGGRGGIDTVDGGAGDDIIFANADGDSLNGGDGIDWLSYIQVNHGVTVDLGQTQELVSTPLGDFVVDVPGSAPDSIVMVTPMNFGLPGRSSFENLAGTNFDDRLTGDRGNNRIEGNDGRDIINGAGGSDILLGGLGPDQLNGGSGVDWVYYNDSTTGVVVNMLGSEGRVGGFGRSGTAEGDTFQDVENILGSSYGDDLTGSNADNVIDPNISGLNVTEKVDGGNGTDTLRLDYSGYYVDKGQGVTGGIDPGGTTSGSFTRTIETVNFSNIERFEITGTRANDTIRTGAGNDIIRTHSGDDIIYSGIGADRVEAGGGNDQVTYGNDSFGNLTDQGGGQVIYLDGGSGIDTLSASLAQINDDVSLTGAAPGRQFFGVNYASQTGTAIVNFEILKNITTGEGWDDLTQEGYYDNIFITGGGSDWINPGFGKDFVDGGAEESQTHYYDGRSPGDFLYLDYSSYGGAAGVVGTAVRDGLNSGGTYKAGPAGNLDVDLTFKSIENLIVVGTDYADFLTGTYDRNQDFFNRYYGKDFLSGGKGNDTIIGYSGGDYLEGGDGDDILVGADPGEAYRFQGGPGDRNEIDYLNGGAGADTFVLGTENGRLYTTSSVFSGSDNYAIIEDFNPEEGDTVQLYGSRDSNSYRIEHDTNGDSQIVYTGGCGPELISKFSGFANFDLGADYIKWVDADHAGVVLTPTTQGIASAPAPDDIAGSFAAVYTLADAAPQSALSDVSANAVTVNGFRVWQTDDINELKDALDGVSDGGATSLTLSGSSEAFGMFDGDPFGLGKGIILSTGRVEDLPGKNTVQSGGGVRAADIPITFEKIGRIDSEALDVYRVDLTGLTADQIRSLTIRDTGLADGGGSGNISGFDLATIIMSSKFLDGATLSSLGSGNALDIYFNDGTRLDVFDYSSASTFYQPGSERDFIEAGDFYGSANGMLNNGYASLGQFERTGGGLGEITLGDAGSIGFNLTAPVNTNGPVYLYIGEYGDPEKLTGTITASPDYIVPTGDLSSDLGALGPDGDTTSLTYTFTPKAGDTGFSLDVVLFTEELPEFDGLSLTDLFTIKLNGKDIGTLSNGAALSIKNLVYSGSGDLIYNPVGSGPLADTIKADAYTKTLRLSGDVAQGSVNTLTIEVKDGRDAFLDSGLLIKDGSFKTYVRPQVTVTVGGIDDPSNDPTTGETGSSGTGTVPSDQQPVVTIEGSGFGVGGGTVTVTTTTTTTHTNPDGTQTSSSTTQTHTLDPSHPTVQFPVGGGGGGTGGDQHIGDTVTVTTEITSTDPDFTPVPVPPWTWTVSEPLNQAPDITSPTGEILVSENTVDVAQIVAVDPDAGQVLTYSIDGGADKDLFKIDAATGKLTFKAAPDFERPRDVGADNVYDVVVKVTDNGATPKSDIQALSVRVTDAAETSTLVVKFVSETADYRNTLGWYNTETLTGGILFSSVEADGSRPTVVAGVTTASFAVNSADVGKIGFFLIPDGGDICSIPDPQAAVKVIKLSNGNWAVALTDSNGMVQTDRNGKPIVLEGAGAPALFTETGKNAGGVDYASSKVGTSQTSSTLAGDTADGPTGLLAWEDQVAVKVSERGNVTWSKPGDADYNDAVFQVSEVKGQTLNGDGTSNTLTGGIAGDVLDGRGGDDTLDAGGGSDRAAGGDGNDLFIHRLAENVGSSDKYDGGAGQDTLRLVLTGAEWARSDVQQDVANFLARSGGSGSFQFGSTDLNVVNIEKLEVVVEGVALDPRDEAATARADVLAVTEDAGGSINVLLNDSVPDRAKSVSIVTNGSKGTASIAASLTGATQAALLSYTPSAAMQALRAGETATDTITYKVTDADGDTSTASVTVTITGVNDTAKISGTSSGSVTEDSSNKATGKLTVTDVDTGENRALAQTDVAGTYGKFTVDATGAWSYALNNAAANVQALTKGQTVKDTFTVKSLDGTASQVVTVNIAGTNDAAVIGAPTAASVTEDVSVSSGKLKATGTISVSDVDQGQSAFQTSVEKAYGTLGSLSLAANGAYTYSVDNNQVQYLRAGESKVENFTIKSLDGTWKTVSFTVYGANDAAVIGSPSVASVTEDVSVSSGKLKAVGTISVSDVDQGQSTFQTSVEKASGALGSLTLSANGAYTYSVDNSAVQYLRAGETKVDSFTVKSLDGTSKTVSFTVYGANDAAVIGNPSVKDVYEDVSVSSGKISAKGTLLVTDADHDQSLFQTGVTGASGNIGTLTLAANGDYTYSASNSAVQGLGDGDVKVDTFTIKSLDGTAKSLAFSIHGANEVINVGARASVSGTSGPDTFVFASAASAGSTISGFVSGEDTLQISASGFGHGLSANTSPILMVTGDHTTVSRSGTAGYFVFDKQGSNAGTLYWDANGGSASDAVALVKLAGVTSLAVSDFHLV